MPKQVSITVFLKDKYSKIADKVAEKTDRLRASLRKADDVTKVASKNWKKSTGSLKIFGNAAKFAASKVNILNGAMGRFFARAAPGLLALKAIQVSGANTVMEKSFQVMTGSKSVGKQLNLDLQEFAANTHYTIPQVQKTAKTLMAYGIGEKDILKNVALVGSISAGSGADIGRVALAFGQITSTGFLQGQDARQLESAGVGIRKLVQEKVKSLHGIDMPMGDIMRAVSNRQIPAEFVHAILQDLTAEGGRFHNILEEINDTLPGQFSNLTDNFIRLGIVWGDGLDATLHIKENLKAANIYMKGMITSLSADPVKRANFGRIATAVTAFVVLFPIVVSILGAAAISLGSIGALFTAGGVAAVGGIVAAVVSFGLLALAITAVGVAVLALLAVMYNYWDEIKAFGAVVLDYFLAIPWLLKQAFIDTFNVLTQMWNNLVDLIFDINPIGLNIMRGPMGMMLDSQIYGRETYKLDLIVRDKDGNIIGNESISPGDDGGEVNLGNGTGQWETGNTPGFGQGWTNSYD